MPITKLVMLMSLVVSIFEPYFSGESMENALRACCKGIKIGKILIHREGDNGQQVCTELCNFQNILGGGCLTFYFFLFCS